MSRWLTRDEFLSCLVDDRLYNATAYVVDSDELARVNYTKPTAWWHGFLSDPSDRVRADFTDWGPAV